MICSRIPRLSYIAPVLVSAFVTGAWGQNAPVGCAALPAEANSGIYVLEIPGSEPQPLYCDNEIEADGRRGGWTLVWSNLRGAANDPATDLSWWVSINTPPRYSGVLPTDGLSTGRQFF